MSPAPTRRAMLAASLMFGAAVAGEVARPSVRLSERKEKIDLERQVPAAFGAWRTDRNVAPILPDPSLQAMLDSLYSQVLARSYFNAQGQYVMLSIAYGSDQGSEATAVHRPEFCYSAQGFQIQMLEGSRLELAGRRIPLARLAGVMGRRRELISYWVTLDESATLPGLGRKVEQIRYGLRGQIPDGMLVRVSSLTAPDDAAFRLQEAFLRDMFEAVPQGVRGRYFGRAGA